ncbi:cell division initiation protein [Bacillus luteolus]|nr:cell division initiation protein [Cytobacillus luteolus]
MSNSEIYGLTLLLIGGGNMPLTPLDIHNKEFNKGFRGYDEDEVNEFLDQVIKDYELVIREKKELEAKLAEQGEKLGHFTNIEDTLNKSILIAQETAEDVKRNAQKEAKLIIKEAEKNADRIINESLAKSRKIAIEIEELKKQSKVFRNRFKMLIEAQLDLIQSDDWDHLMKYNVEPVFDDSEDNRSKLDV